MPATRSGGTDAMMGVIFFVLAAILFPFGVGPDAAILPRIGGGIIWVVALLAALLSLERMFAADHEDGSLDLLYLSPVSLAQLALAKAISHWLTTGVLLLIASPVLALLYNLTGFTMDWEFGKAWYWAGYNQTMSFVAEKLKPHSIGLGIHDRPFITPEDDRLTEPGMVMQIEHITTDGDELYHAEDSVLFTESGVTLLSDYTDTTEMYVIE